MASKSITIDDELFARAHSIVSKEFNGKWSTYINQLIANDLNETKEREEEIDKI